MAGNYNTLIGHGARLPNSSGNNQIVIGSTAAATYLGGGAVVCTSGALTVSGSLTVRQNGVTGIPPLVYGDGSATALAGTYSGQPILIQVGTASGSTTAAGALSGSLVVEFPLIFPNGVLTILTQETTEYNATTGNYVQYSYTVINDPPTNNVTNSGFSAIAYQVRPGTALTTRNNTRVSFNYTALGF